MLDAVNWQIHSVSQRNKVKIQPVNYQLNDQEKILKKIMAALILNQTSTASITEESVNRDQNFLNAAPITIHSTDGVALKLNHLKEKFASYVRRKDFISQCIKGKIFPKGFT